MTWQLCAEPIYSWMFLIQVMQKQKKIHLTWQQHEGLLSWDVEKEEMEEPLENDLRCKMHSTQALMDQWAVVCSQARSVFYPTQRKALNTHIKHIQSTSIIHRPVLGALELIALETIKKQRNKHTHFGTGVNIPTGTRVLCKVRTFVLRHNTNRSEAVEAA